MPTYVYRCKACQHEFEEFQSITDKPLEDCPVCQGKVERLISGGAGFLFKGEGFYITDYRSERYKKDAAADTGGSAGSSAPPPAKPGKPAAPKTETKGKGSQLTHRAQGRKGG